MATSSKVFISYSHESQAHNDRVLNLAIRLVNEGINCQLDRWTDEPDGGWPLWMESQISNCNFVILVCTEVYRTRVENPYAESAGFGVFWEVNSIRNHLYNTKGRDKRFIPVVFGASGTTWIPNALQGVSHYQIDDPDGYTALYRRITGQAEIERPALG